MHNKNLSHTYLFIFLLLYLDAEFLCCILILIKNLFFIINSKRKRCIIIGEKYQVLNIKMKFIKK